jgi:hypothetical protein
LVRVFPSPAVPCRADPDRIAVQRRQIMMNWNHRKTGRIWTASTLLALALAGRLGAAKDGSTADVMRLKLDHAHKVMTALALHDFGGLQRGAEELSRLSQASGWHARQTPEYQLFTTEFRRAADSLAEAAKAKNIDAATVAYTQVTFSCVSCHKYMRGGRVEKTGFRTN